MRCTYFPCCVLNRAVMVVKNFWLHKLNKKESSRRLCTSNNFPLITARRRGSSSCLLYLPPANYSYKGGQNTTVFTIRTMISFFTLCSGMLKRGQSLLKREHYPAQISRISLAFSKVHKLLRQIKRQQNERCSSSRSHYYSLSNIEQ